MNDHKILGKAEKIYNDGEIPLLIGHYAIFNQINKAQNFYPKITIHGLGSCIALILYDKTNNVGGMSHILLPRANPHKEFTYPHKYADLSVQLLVRELIDHGADKKNIKAIIVGGSKIFDLDENIVGLDNATVTREELNKLQIQIVKEDLGGVKGRSVVFDSRDFSVKLKKIGDDSFIKL